MEYFETIKSKRGNWTRGLLGAGKK